MREIEPGAREKETHGGGAVPERGNRDPEEGRETSIVMGTQGEEGGQRLREVGRAETSPPKKKKALGTLSSMIYVSLWVPERGGGGLQPPDDNLLCPFPDGLGRPRALPLLGATLHLHLRSQPHLPSLRPLRR